MISANLRQSQPILVQLVQLATPSLTFQHLQKPNVPSQSYLAKIFLSVRSQSSLLVSQKPLPRKLRLQPAVGKVLVVAKVVVVETLDVAVVVDVVVGAVPDVVVVV